jgi:hypothetical protein
VVRSLMDSRVPLSRRSIVPLVRAVSTETRRTAYCTIPTRRRTKEPLRALKSASSTGKTTILVALCSPMVLPHSRDSNSKRTRFLLEQSSLEIKHTSKKPSSEVSGRTSRAPSSAMGCGRTSDELSSAVGGHPSQELSLAVGMQGSQELSYSAKCVENTNYRNFVLTAF